MIRAFAIAAVVVTVGAASFFLARTSTTGSKGDDSELSDKDRAAVYATAMAETRTRVTADGMNFSKSGINPDALPRLTAEVSGRRQTDPARATHDADAVVLAKSLGGWVDPSDGRLYLRLAASESVKGSIAGTVLVQMGGGPQTTYDGEWFLLVSSAELYLPAGESAILFLGALDDGRYTQRPYQAILLNAEGAQDRDGFAFRTTFDGKTTGEILNLLRGAVR